MFRGDEAKLSVAYESFPLAVPWFRTEESQICLLRELFHLKINI